MINSFYFDKIKAIKKIKKPIEKHPELEDNSYLKVLRVFKENCKSG